MQTARMSLMKRHLQLRLPPIMATTSAFRYSSPSKSVFTLSCPGHIARTRHSTRVQRANKTSREQQRICTVTAAYNPTLDPLPHRRPGFRLYESRQARHLHQRPHSPSHLPNPPRAQYSRVVSGHGSATPVRQARSQSLGSGAPLGRHWQGDGPTAARNEPTWGLEWLAEVPAVLG
jgi:hypothetical protein